MKIMLRMGVSLFGGDNEYKGRMKTKFTYLFGLVLIIFNSSCCTNKFVSSSYTNRIECKEELGFSIYDLSIDILEFQNGKKWLDTSSFSLTLLFQFEIQVNNFDTFYYPKYLGLRWPLEDISSTVFEKFIDSFVLNSNALDFINCVMMSNLYWYSSGGQFYSLRIENDKGTLNRRKRKINPLMYDALKNRKKLKQLKQTQ